MQVEMEELFHLIFHFVVLRFWSNNLDKVHLLLGLNSFYFRLNCMTQDAEINFHL